MESASNRVNIKHQIILLRRFLATALVFIGSFATLVMWLMVTAAYTRGTWMFTWDFNKYGEGFPELVLFTVIVAR